MFTEFHKIEKIKRCNYSCRLKNTHTIVEKLKRDSTRLNKMQDVGGIRIIMSSNNHDEQDEIGNLIQSETSMKNIEVFDRRSEPSSGYRAVHIVGEVEGSLLEVQVRTELQHSWAQVFERLADIWGREIRYGKLPVNAPFKIGKIQSNRHEVYFYMKDLSKRIDEGERNHPQETEDVRSELIALREVLEATQLQRTITLKIPEIPDTQDLLVVYDRNSGTVQQYHVNIPEVLYEKWRELDLKHRSDNNIEIVLLAGDSKHNLEQTHTRYFKPAADLAGPAPQS